MNVILPFVEIFMELGIIMLTEIKHTQKKQTLYTLSSYAGILQSSPELKTVVIRGWERLREVDSTLGGDNGSQYSVSCMENPKRSIGRLHTYTESELKHKLSSQFMQHTCVEMLYGATYKFVQVLWGKHITNEL